MNKVEDFVNFSTEYFEAKKEEILKEKLEQKDLHEVLRPKLILLCGQPGAGKSGITRLYKERLKNNVIVTDIDDYRRKHPYFNELTRISKNDWTKHTQDFASEMGIAINEELIKRNYNVIVDGTGKNLGKNERLIQQYKDNGFTVEVVVIATKPELSKIGIISRYAKSIKDNKPARSVPLSVHTDTIGALPYNLNKLQKNSNVEGVYIYNRQAECLFDSNISQGQAGDFLKNIYNQTLTIEERTQIKQSCAEIYPYLPNNRVTEEYFEVLKDVQYEIEQLDLKEKSKKENELTSNMNNNQPNDKMIKQVSKEFKNIISNRPLKNKVITKQSENELVK